MANNLVRLRAVILGFTIAIHLSVAAQGEDLQKKITKLFDGRKGAISLSLRNNEGKEIANFNGDTPLLPASVAKTVSTACSLHELGPNFQFQTDFGTTGKINGGVLNGDLVVRGGGDPSLVMEDLYEIIDKLRFVRGIKKITGSLVFDVSYFGQKSLQFGQGFEGDEGRSFTAELTPTPFNQNSFAVWVSPANSAADLPRVAILPHQVNDLTIKEKVRSGDKTEVGVDYSSREKIVRVSGTIARDAEPKGIYRSVDDPYAYYSRLLRELWVQSGGEWANPKVQFATTPIDFRLLWRHQSRPLAKILMDINKFSLNLGAELVFLAAGSHMFKPPATYEKSGTLLSQCLANSGFSKSDFVMTNASGLSRQTTFKTTALTQFLNNQLKEFDAPEYLSSFGLIGVDGTAKGFSSKYIGRARLKTGSIQRVHSLAGYLYGPSKQIYSFALIQNDVDIGQAVALEKQFIEVALGLLP